jgi:hypothetical protein
VLPRLQSSDIMASRDLDEGIHPEFAPPRGARHPALRPGRRPAHRRPEADGVPLPGPRAFWPLFSKRTKNNAFLIAMPPNSAFVYFAVRKQGQSPMFLDEDE